ncbi:mediator of RNA polymerase II transcription complex subunit 8-domain-containing protein [Apodospora peruviana]|uniref:Mediator of RNA polymerase II transcription subunit 8 n=1 Tax=Apodospora peruviana TaxID=516989 RepID=A0AAE0IPZ9_9PEZI|nr:mediator of RNA polymerase II transcription complex subunit 8-domain-containing protein [Apodospora peruviana]
MASLNLAPEESKQIELLRNRFTQLTHSLESLLRDMYTIQPLPSRESLQASATILQHTIYSIQHLSNDNADLFQRITVHPSTNFPGRTQEHVLLTLLRKKLEPDVEKWVEDAREAARVAGIDVTKLSQPGNTKKGGGGYDEEDDDEDVYGGGDDNDDDVPSDAFNEQWADIKNMCFEAITDYIQNQAGKLYTTAERAQGIRNVRTGLRRSLADEEDEDDEEDESSDEDEDEDENNKMDEDLVEVPRPGAPVTKPVAKVNGATPKMEPEHMLWFLARGDVNIPPNLDIESTRKVRMMARAPAFGKQ